MKKFIRISLWIVATMLIWNLYSMLITASDTFINIFGILVAIGWVWFTATTKFFLNFKNLTKIFNKKSN